VEALLFPAAASAFAAACTDFARDNEVASLAISFSPEKAIALFYEERSGRLAWNSHESSLHDTLAPRVFDRSRREISHGCIRVQEPEKLAAWVLRNQAEWTPECVHNAVEEGPAPSGPRAMANLPRS